MKEKFTNLYGVMCNASKYAKRLRYVKPALLCNAKLKMNMYRMRSSGTFSAWQHGSTPSGSKRYQSSQEQGVFRKGEC